MKCAYYCCLALLPLGTSTLYGQFYFSGNNKTEPELLWEAGIAAGAFNCLTDIGGNNGAGKKFIKDINWNQTQWGGSAHISAAWHYQFALRLEATLTRVAGSDAVLKNSNGLATNRYHRNLQFRTNLTEMAMLSEWHLLQLVAPNRDVSLLSPYIIAGLGFFHYNPQAWYRNAWVDLRPLHTEGQGFPEFPERSPYTAFTWCVPAGAGIKYDAAGLFNLRLEIVYRFTGTDYLDDVSCNYIDPALFAQHLPASQSNVASQLSDRSAEITSGAKNNPNAIRGNSSNKDAWFSCTLKASLVLGRLQRK